MKKPIPWERREARRLAAQECDSVDYERHVLNGGIDDHPPMIALQRHIAASLDDPYLLKAREVAIEVCKLKGAPMGSLEIDYQNGSKDTSLEVMCAHYALLLFDRLPS
jgi:hypothetical protein